ncbi:T9SS type A sorting domain-containing protein, partial [Aequorivita lipolytica]
TNQATVFWEYTDDIPVEGEPYAKFDSTIGTWAIDDPAQEVVYNFSGQCDPMGGGGGSVLDTAYGVNNGNFELIGFPVSDPSTVEVFGNSPVTVNFENAGAIDPANPRTGYVLDNGGQFYSFDVESGIYTLLGNIPGDWVGMEYDQASGVLYAIAGADLYTIDPVAISATLVGATGIPPGNLPIALAIDGAGIGYTYEIVTDNLYSIDLATATATLIGNIGFDANFGQGMCYDALTDTVYMAAFNSGVFAAEWRSVNLTTGATTLIGPIVTTAATTQVAWVSIGETLPPPACPEPTNLAVTNIAADSADLSWDAEPSASSGYIWYVFLQGDNPLSDPPVATGTVPAGTTTATATGLSGGISYDFYVVADCDADGLSQLAGPVSFATPPACGGKFYDTGGPGGDYENDENVTTVINPANAGDKVTVTFTAFDVEATWDALYVYDGPDATFPIISSGNPPTTSGFPAGGYYGTSNPGPFTATDASGALTFVFLSDASVPRAGWEADVTCAPTPPPNDMIVNSIDVDEIGFPYTDPQVNMPAATTEDGNPAGCDLSGANGVWYNFVSGGDGTAIASIVTPGGASSVTFYTAPNENASETDLTLVPQQSNQCGPGTSASIFTLAGQAYYVFVLNTGAVTDITIDGTNLGVSDNTIAGFSYYPNPTNGVLNLKSVDNIENVSMYNLLGQLMMNNQVDANTSQLDISGLSTGIYLMKVSVNGQIGTYRILKQ